MVTGRKADLTAPISRARCFALLIAGVLMVGMGSYVIFENPNPPAIPMWFVWLGGLLLSYVGVAVSIGGVAWALFGGPVGQAQAEAPVLWSDRVGPNLLIPAEALLDVPPGAD